MFTFWSICQNNVLGNQLAASLAFFHCSFGLSTLAPDSEAAKLDMGSLGALLAALASSLV